MMVRSGACRDKLAMDMQAVQMDTLEHESAYIGVHKTLGRFGD